MTDTRETHHARTLRRPVLVVAAAALAATALTGCGGPDFAVGDCVKIEQKVIDSELKEASCSDARGTFDQSERTYKVNSVIEGTSGSCPQLQGFFPVEFTDEPADVIYCLVQADGS